MRKMAKTTVVISAICLLVSFVAFADLTVFDMESGDPITNQWMGDGGTGTQTHAQSTDIAHGGSASCLWSYTLETVPAGHYPTTEMAVPAGKTDWTGGTQLSVWMYFDLTDTKTYWTIQPNLQHPWPTGDDIGNWDAGLAGVPAATWIEHSWDIDNPAWDLSNVSHLRFYYHAGDGWAGVAKDGKVDIYLDDITVIGAASAVESWELY